MSITVADINASVEPGRCGFVTYLVTRSGGDWALSGSWVNGAYSGAPGTAADGTARSTGSDGVYVGLASDAVSAYPATLWGTDPPNGLDTDGNTSPSGGATADPTDSAAVSDVASAAADSGVLAAIAAALGAVTPLDYATAAPLTVLTDAFVSASTYSLSSTDLPPYGLTEITSGATGTDTTNHGAVTVVSSDTSICLPGTPTYDPTGNGQMIPGYVTFMSYPGGTGTVTLTSRVLSDASPAGIVSVWTLTVTS